jgi:hypothetical protein
MCSIIDGIVRHEIRPEAIIHAPDIGIVDKRVTDFGCGIDAESAVTQSVEFFCETLI